MKTSSVEFISRSPTPSPMERNYRRFSSGLHGSTAADSVRSEWPLWHAAKSKAVFARRRSKSKPKRKLLDIRAELERKENERGFQRYYTRGHESLTPRLPRPPNTHQSREAYSIAIVLDMRLANPSGEYLHFAEIRLLKNGDV
ncbi:hypothetical protein TNCV_1893901 [Trichonephila clavipes]|nr:hypothetical protein TNCV_1893901 [Trichonephila clavipes]